MKGFFFVNINVHDSGINALKYNFWIIYLLVYFGVLNSVPLVNVDFLYKYDTVLISKTL